MKALEIKNIRKKLGLNQTDFGKLLGVSLSAVQMWESGNRNISKSASKLLNDKVIELEKKRDYLNTYEMDKDILMELEKFEDSAIITYVYLNKERFKKQKLYNIIGELFINEYKMNRERTELKEIINEVLKENE